MKKHTRRILAAALVLVMLVGVLPISTFGVTSVSEPTYKVEIVSFVRGLVDDLRCSELLEARIYKSTDNGNTWVTVTDVDGVSVSSLRYTWTNNSHNTSMIVCLTHNMTEVDIYGDTQEGTFKDGVSSSAIGGRWAALKTPGYDTHNGGMIGGRPGSTSSQQSFSGSVSVSVALPNGTTISDSCTSFGKPDLDADLNNIALGMFIGDSTTGLNLLGESGIVHINCSMCNVSNIRVTDNEDDVINYRNGKITGRNMGEATISMDVNKRNCTVHNGQSASVSTKIFVFQKPTTSTTTTTLTLASTSIDERCKYYINGVEGTKQSDGSIIFTGLNPNTKYTVDVVASYSITNNGNTITRHAYAYVSDTTKPLYTATVKTYLNSVMMDVESIHGENVELYIKTENGNYIPLKHSGTGVYTADVENGIYNVYHLEDIGYHKINNNPLIISNTSASVDVHHYSVIYDTEGGAFKTEEDPGTVNYASGKPVTATTAIPTKEDYVFIGWSYGNDTYLAGKVVTNSISAPIVLSAIWARNVDVFVNVTIDHTYYDANGNLQVDINDTNKDKAHVSLVGRNDANSPYLEIDGGDLSLNAGSHNGHDLYADGTKVDSYAGLDAEQIKKTEYKDGDTATFTNLPDAKDYFVTVSKAGYSASVNATKLQNGDWVIDITLEFAPTSQDLEFEINMDSSVPEELYPEAAIVKVLYYDAADNSWKVITQHSNGNPGVRVEIENQTGNKGSYPVWVYDTSNAENPYGYRIQVSAFVYADGTIVSTEETTDYEIYTDKNYTATIGKVNDGTLFGTLNGASFINGVQVGTLDAIIKVESYDVTFNAMGGTVNGNATQTVTNQYYIPDFDQYQPVMENHKFLGWWYQDQNGNYVELATDGVLLTEDITLYAMWDQTLTGSLNVAGKYTLNGQEVEIWENDRATEAIVVLQEIALDAINNIDYVIVTINWANGEGISDEYSFTGLDPMKQYRISVILTNYNTEYQNSTTAPGSYNADDYRAVYQQDDMWETFVNGKLTFDPESYYLSVEVDASHIGSGFRPDEVLTEIWYTENNTNNPYAIISQHGATGGILVKLDADGKTDGTFGEYVWKENFNGNLYDYKLVVSDTAVLDLPIVIVYGPNASYNTLTESATNSLTATLLPKKYSVIYDLNTDSEDDIITTFDAHTWSHDTEITFVPTREGYVFKGWVADTDLYDDNTIDASVSQNVTLTATWEKADYGYTVNYYFDGVLEKTENFSAKYLDVINLDFDDQVVYDNKNYALDYIDGQPLEIGTDESANVISVYYASDDGDGIPDKYQKKIIFKVENGTWDGTNDEDIIKYVTLLTNGEWDVNGSAAMPTAPTGMKANSGFKKGSWNVSSFPEIVSGTDTVTYTYKFNPTAYIDYTYYIEHYIQLPDGSYALKSDATESITIQIELNADENGFENVDQSAVNAIAKDFGAHYSFNANHPDSVASGIPQYDKALTLKLFYALDSHTVKYDLNSGTPVPDTDYSDMDFLCGSNVTVKAAPKKTGYVFNGWLSQSGELYLANDVFTVNSDVTLTAQWSKLDNLSYIVKYLEEDTGITIKPEKRIDGMTFEDVISSESEIVDIYGYIFAYAEPDRLIIGTDVNTNVIYLYYTPDHVGGGDNGDEPDNVPDKYQKKIIFKVENGTWDGTNDEDIIKYVLLLTNGEWDVNGSATIDEQIVPTGMFANEGYDNGTWDATLPTTVSGTSDAVYTFGFDKILPPPPTGDISTVWLVLLVVVAGAGIFGFIMFDRKKRSSRL